MVDEPAVNGAEPESAFPCQTSTEKVRAALTELAGTEPSTPIQGALMTALQTFQPLLEVVLPEDPAELDEVLLIGAKWALWLRSDNAPPVETVDELFLGVEPAGEQ